MNWLSRSVLIVSLMLLVKLGSYAQNISNEGTEFWAVFPTHDPSSNDNPDLLATIQIYITSKTGSSGTISYGSVQRRFTVEGDGRLYTTPLQRQQAYISVTESNRVIQNRGINIKVDEGAGKIAVYAHIFAGFRSAASLILPVEALGQKYYSMNYTQNPPGRNFLVLVATEANTDLLIHRGSEVIPITLENAGDVYQYMPSDYSDLTGTFVEIDPASPDNCNKRFAAFSGSTSISIGNCQTSRDPLYQQLYPVTSWGKTYGVVPFINRRYIIRVVAQENATRVRIPGVIDTVLNQGALYSSPELFNPVFITADKKVSTAQYALTQGCSSISREQILGDPEMVVLNPIEFNIKSVTLFSSRLQSITERYINVLMKTAATGSFQIDGSNEGLVWRLVPGNPEYSYMQKPISTEIATLTAADGFNAIAYGFGTTESYAYSAGTSLAANNYLKVSNIITNNDADNACFDQASDFKVFLPALAEKISWTLDDNPPVEGSISPSNVIYDSSGSPVYEYTYDYGQAFTEFQQHKMTVNVRLTTSGNCISNDYVYTYSFGVEPVPVADFDFSNLGCELEGTKFTDMSDSNIPSKPIGKWLWDFGDGSQPSTEQNPVHYFPRTGTYQVKLTAGTIDGCLSSTFVKEVTIAIIPSPEVTFDALPDICLNGGTVLINAAREIKGVAGKGTYSGKGITPEGLFDPLMAGVGTHVITYLYRGSQITEGKAYCEDIATRNITVLPLPDIELDSVFYILVDGTKRFTATDFGPQSAYKWSPSAGLDRDDVLNPVIKGEVNRRYTLTATTPDGCIMVYSIQVNVLEDIAVSNAFSPNGDGINDVWTIEYLDSYPNVTIQVFNRYGVSVFSSRGYSNPFDGRHQNQDLPAGVYFYVLDPGNGKPRKTGSLSLIR